MAQDYVGSNNIPLLHPSGQFGTRHQGGKDAASARYIFTRLTAAARKIFPTADSGLLTYAEDDGLQVEPKFFVPVLPMLLVNGAHGIGTGWKSYVGGGGGGVPRWGCCCCCTYCYSTTATTAPTPTNSPTSAPLSGTCRPTTRWTSWPTSSG